ncbi:MAG: hypothetical protein A3B11_01350 [Candidatus Taylorbacteria bacterium RIFCSPLOWO2_01_FULL_44_26]|uniref:30S ribosomal protein S21 n=2 Tax=Candidatus Tayloriibacteriota TaxID=1817919 RepID=A0A1G2N4M3_9BACT|nr:MAG: hypothetical protein A3B11_01350 [Candidatus Taylorbacteria bacterium RIFCSPLOWO2_01_FULL_44_26]
MRLMINVEVTKNSGENGISLIRRFSRKVQGAGILPRVRGLRFNSRVQSAFKVKQRALKGISRRAAMAELVKLGKAPVKKTRGGK